MKQSNLLIKALAAVALLGISSPLGFAASTNTWVGGSGNNFSTTANWSYSSGSGPLASGDSLIFGSTGSTTPNNDETAFSFNSITFTNTAQAYTVGGNGLTLNGTLADNASVDETINFGITLGSVGGTLIQNTVSGHTLALGTLTHTAGNGSTVNFTTTGAISTTTTDNNGMIGGWAVIDNGNNTYSWAHSGSSGANNITAATTTTTASSTANWAPTAVQTIGNTTVNSLIEVADVKVNNATTLTIGSGGMIFQGANFWLQPASGSASVNSGLASGELFVHTPNAANTDTRITLKVVDNGATPVILVKNGPGYLRLDGVNTYSGGTMINAGLLTIGSAGSLGSGSYSAGIRNNGSFVYNSSAAQTLSGAISGTGAVTESGAGTLTLSSANTYSGGTTITGGTLSVGNNNALGSGAVTFTGGSLSDSTAVTIPNNFSATGGGTFNASGGTMVLNGNITGGGSIALTSANKITLAGINSFATNGGNLGVNAGAGGVDITGSTTVGSGNSVANSGYMNVSGTTTITVQSGGSLSVFGTLNATVPGGIVGQNAAGTSTLLVNGGSVTFGGNMGLAFGNNVNTAIGVLTITNNGMATISAGSTTLQDQRNYIAMGRDNATGIINLAPGTLASGRQFVRDGSSGGTAGAGVATFNFNGGKLQALANQTAGNGWFETAASGNFQVVTTTIMDGGAIIDPNGFTVNINTVLAHGGVAATDGGLTLTNSSGTGILTLGGASTYTGPTIVNGGILKVTGNVPTATTVNPGGAIGASSGTFGALVTLAAGNSAVNQQDGAAATTTFANGLTLNNGNVLAFDLGSSSDLISVGGTFTHNGTAAINLAAISGFSATTYTLITGASITATNGFVLGSVPAGFSGTLVSDGANLQVALTQNAPSVAFWKGDVDNKWSSVTGGNNSNWATDSSGATDTVVPPSTPTAVTFAATGAANFSTVLGANFVINDLTLSTANNVTIAGTTNSLTLVAGLVNASTALNNSITVSNLVLGTSQTFENDSANPLTVSSLISGSSTLTIAGAGTVVLTSTNNNYNGGTTISSGALQLGDGTTSNGAVSGTVTDNSVLVFANPTAQTFSGAIGGAGQLVKAGAGVLTLPSANTYSSGTIVSNGTLQLNINTAAGAGTITVNSNLNLNIGNASLANTVNGGGTINVLLTGNNGTTFAGDMSGFTGAIKVASSGGLGSKATIQSTGVNLNSAASITVSNGGTFFTENATVAATINVSGAGNSEGYGALRVDNQAIISGNVNLLGNTTIGGNWFPSGSVNGFSGVIDDNNQGYGIGAATTLPPAANVIANGGMPETLWGVNTYHGPTTWNNSRYILLLANGSAIQNSTLNFTAGKVQFDSSVSSNSFVFGGLTGTANLTLANTGGAAITLSVGNNNSNTTYSGVLSDNALGSSLTKVGNGTLTLAGANSYSGTTTVAAGKLAVNTLQTNATAGMVVNDGATLMITAVGTNQVAPAIYTLGSSSGPVTNEFAGLSSTNFAPVNAGTLTLAGQTTVNINGGSFVVGDTYPLISYTSIGGAGGFQVGSLPRGMAGSIVTNGGNTIALSVTAFTPAKNVWTGSVNTNWDIATTANWQTNGGADVYFEGDSTRFDDTATATNVFVTTVVSPSSMIVSNVSKTFSFTGSAIGGAVSLNKQGTGMLVLGQANTYAGNTVISNGTLKVATASAIPTGSGKGDVVVGGAGVLDVNSTSITINGLSGNGTVDTVTGGNPTLTVGNNGASSTFSGTLQNSSGSLALTKTGNGTLTLSGAASALTGQLQVNGGTLNWNTVGALAPSAGDFRPLFVQSGGVLNVNGSLKYSSGTAGVNGYLQIGNNAAGGYGTININSGGVLTFTNLTGNPGSVIGQQGTGGTSYLNVNGGAFNWDGSSALLVGNGGGNGVLLITNGGTAMILKGTGIMEEGYLALGRDSASSSGTLYLANGTLATDRIICQGLAPVSGTGYVFFDGGTLKALANQTDWLQSVVNGNAQPPSVTINTGAAVVDANGFSVAIGNALASGASPDGGLVLIDSSLAKNGVLILGGASSYNGATVVSNGTLLVNGSISTGATTVKGGTLGGTGTIGGSLDVNSGATLAPGSAGSGVLTVNGNLTLNAGSTNAFAVDGTTPANVAVTAGASVTYGGVLKIVPSGTFTVGQTFTLFSGAGATSASHFSSIQVSPGSGLGFTFTNGVLSVVTSGPSGPATITNSVSSGVLSLSWPAGQGWRLQMQTNSLATGLGTNWTYITDGSLSSTNITIDPSKPTVFYRLTNP